MRRRDVAGAVVEGQHDGPRVAGYRRSAQHHGGRRDGAHRIRRDRGADRRNREPRLLGIAGAVYNDQSHTGSLGLQVAGRIRTDGLGQSRGDLFERLAIDHGMTEGLDGAGNIELDRPYFTGRRRTAQDDRAGDLRRPRRLEGHLVTGHQRQELRSNPVREVECQMLDGLAGSYHVAVRCRSAIEIQIPCLTVADGQHLESGLGPLRCKDFRVVLIRCTAYDCAAQTAGCDFDLELRPVIRGDTDLCITEDVNERFCADSDAASLINIVGPGCDDLGQCPAIRRYREWEGMVGRPIKIEIEPELPCLADACRTCQADDGFGPAQRPSIDADCSLLRCSTEQHLGIGGGYAVDLQIDCKRCIPADGQDFLGDRRHVQESADGRSVEEGKLEREFVHTRIKARTLAEHGVEVECLVIVHHCLAVGVCSDAVNRAVGLWLIGFLRQTEWIVEEALCSNKGATLDGQRTADSVYALFKSREYQGVTAVNDLIVDCHHGNDLRLFPVGVIENHLRRDDRSARAVGRDHDTCLDILGLVCRGVADGQDASTDDDVKEVYGPGQDRPLLDLLTHLAGDQGQIVVEISGINGYILPVTTHPDIVLRSIPKLQGPGLVNGNLAGQLDLNEVEDVAVVTRDFNGCPACSVRPDLVTMVNAYGGCGIERRGRSNQQSRRVRDVG